MHPSPDVPTTSAPHPLSPLIIGDSACVDFTTDIASVLLIPPAARTQHTYIIGRSGSGKSWLMRSMIAQDLVHDQGLALLDPHGTLAEECLAHVLPERVRTTVLIEPKAERPVGFNVLAGLTPATAAKRVDDITQAFLHLWGRDAIGPESERLLRHILRTLADVPRSTLLGALRLLTDTGFRDLVTSRARDPVTRNYWQTRVATMDADAWEAVTRPLSNKLDAVLSDPHCRAVLCQETSSFDMRRLMDEQRILIANLGGLGEGVSHLIGALIASAITSTAFERGDTGTPPPPFHLYADEFQVFTSGAFDVVLAQARKYGLHLTVAHQFLEQLPRSLRASTQGNATNVFAFRIAAQDAALLAPQLRLDHIFAHSDMGGADRLVDLPNFHAYCSTVTAGRPSTHLVKPYVPPPAVNRRPDAVRRNTAARFGRARSDIDAAVTAFLTPPRLSRPPPRSVAVGKRRRRR